MNIEELVKKHIDRDGWSLSPNGEVASAIRAALTEQAETHALELRAYEATVANLNERIRQMEAEQVPEGWRFDRCSDGTINVIKDTTAGVNVGRYAEDARRIPEEVLWMLANDMLAAAPAQEKV